MSPPKANKGLYKKRRECSGARLSEHKLRIVVGPGGEAPWGRSQVGKALPTTHGEVEIEAGKLTPSGPDRAAIECKAERLGGESTPMCGCEELGPPA